MGSEQIKVQGITKIVSALDRSKRFCEDVLGFEPAASYEPTRWQSYKMSELTFWRLLNHLVLQMRQIGYIDGLRNDADVQAIGQADAGGSGQDRRAEIRWLR